MSSLPVTQLLQISAPQADANLRPSDLPQTDRFQELLARASKTPEEKPVQENDPPKSEAVGNEVSDQNEQESARSENNEIVSASDEQTPEADEIVEPDVSQADAVEISESAVAAGGVLEKTLVEDAPIATASEGQQLVAEAVDTTASDSQPKSNPEPATTPSEVPTVTGAQQNLGEEIPADALVASEQEAEQSAAPNTVFEPQDEATPTLSENFSQEDSHLQDGENPAADERTLEPSSESSQTTIPTQPLTATQDTQSAGSSPVVSAGLKDGPVDAKNEQQNSKEQPTATPSEDAPQSHTPIEAEKQLAVETTPAPSSSSTANHTPQEATAAAPQGTSAGLTGENSSVSSNDVRETELVPTGDRARFVQRVSRAMKMAPNRDGQIQLRLSPPELGSLRIEISTQQGVVSAKVEAETAAARNILLDNLPALRERLAELEIRIEKFDVDVRREGGQDTGNSGAEDRQPRKPASNNAAQQQSPSKQKTSSAEHAVNGTVLDSTTELGLDIRV